VNNVESVSSVDEAKFNSRSVANSVESSRQPVSSGNSVASTASAVCLNMSVDCVDDEPDMQQRKQVDVVQPNSAYRNTAMQDSISSNERTSKSTCELKKLPDNEVQSGEPAATDKIQSRGKEQTSAFPSFGDLAKTSDRLFKGVVQGKSTPINDSFSYRDMTVVISSDEEDEVGVGNENTHCSENALKQVHKSKTATAAVQMPNDEKLTLIKKHVVTKMEDVTKTTSTDYIPRQLPNQSNKIESQDAKLHPSAGPDCKSGVSLGQDGKIVHTVIQVTQPIVSKSGVSLGQDGKTVTIQLAKPNVSKSGDQMMPTVSSHKVEAPQCESQHPAIESQGAKSRAVLNQSSKPLAEIQLCQPSTNVDVVDDLRRTLAEREKISRLLTSKQVDFLALYCTVCDLGLCHLVA